MPEQSAEKGRRIAVGDEVTVHFPAGTTPQPAVVAAIERYSVGPTTVDVRYADGVTGSFLPGWVRHRPTVAGDPS